MTQEQMQRKYPVRDWKEAVAKGFTMLGYKDWMVEQAALEQGRESTAAP